MNLDKDHYQSLFEALLEGKLPPEEANSLLQWLTSNDPEAAQLITNQLGQQNSPGQIDISLLEKLEKKFPLILQSTKTRVFSLRNRWMRYAAIFILVMAGTAIYFITQKSAPETAKVTPSIFKTDIQPGKDGAILTLDDGRTMVLDSLGNGYIADQNGAKVLLQGGKLIYETGKTESVTDKIAYNTITTPNGRQFSLVLPDGTKVWLNAASSLRYPTIFDGGERKVQVTGEAYFEVASNPKMPFKVAISNETEIEVLGTHFNLNCYTNEPYIKTTLLEGSVQVSSSGEKAKITPGQQARISGAVISTNNSPGKKIRIVDNIDIDKVMAWKNGVFDFTDATLQEVMQQLERWYDIDVVYEGNIPEIEFVGKMGRDLSLLNVLQGLETVGVHFRLEQPRKLIIMP